MIANPIAKQMLAVKASAIQTCLQLDEAVQPEGWLESLELFDIAVRLIEWTRAPYMIENPISTVSTYWRKPDFTFDP